MRAPHPGLSLSQRLRSTCGVSCPPGLHRSHRQADRSMSNLVQSYCLLAVCCHLRLSGHHGWVVRVGALVGCNWYCLLVDRSISQPPPSPDPASPIMPLLIAAPKWYTESFNRPCDLWLKEMQRFASLLLIHVSQHCDRTCLAIKGSRYLEDGITLETILIRTFAQPSPPDSLAARSSLPCP
ncbi:hypothetical protein C8Q72DRAFT_822426 [Fomitopsis betulina]|nr:hypothetical protein C8Q72DRAFT_822426 [Fomitopsis betulina]